VPIIPSLTRPLLAASLRQRRQETPVAPPPPGDDGWSVWQDRESGSDAIDGRGLAMAGNPIRAADRGDHPRGARSKQAGLAATPPDVPEDVTTTATIAIGTTMDGVLDPLGDRDWFRVELVAGERYVFTINPTGSGDITDSILRFYDGAGTLIGMNDDANGSFSRFTYRATTTGSHYVSVGALEDWMTGNYRVGAELAPPPTVFTNDQIAFQLTNTFWGGLPRRFDVTPGDTLTVNVTPLTPAGQFLAREALLLWSDATGITFSEVTGSARIRFDDFEFGAFADFVVVGGVIQSSKVNVSTDWLSTYGTGLSSFYGTPSTTRTGDTIYGFNNNSGRAIFDAAQFAGITYTIVDHGGSDTLDYSGFGQNQRIDLNPEAFSNVGGSIGNVTIARGTVIERAIGGGGNDSLVGNAADNFLDGGAGNDTLSGGDGSDILVLNDGGADAAMGGAGNDGFYFGAAFGVGDSVDGGADGQDQIGLQGAYAAAPLRLDAARMTGIETVALLSGSDGRFGDAAGNSYSYHFSLADSLVAAGRILTFNANALLAGEHLQIDGAEERDGAIMVFGGLGRETLTGGEQSDGFFFGDGRFDPLVDSINGTAGTDDQIGLRGDYSALLVFGAATIRNIDTISLTSATDLRYGAPGQAFSYNIRTADDNLAAGAQLSVNGAGLAANEVLGFDGAAETNGFFRIIGGAGADVLTGGAGDDVIFGGMGADQLTGNGGNDSFVYTLTAQSTAAARDMITGFAAGDRIDLSTIDAVTGGADNAFTFIGAAAFTAAGQVRLVQDGANRRLEANVDADLGAGLTILITPGGGYVPAEGDLVL
jgi:Ca2+-binding RTX toxin-like protein